MNDATPPLSTDHPLGPVQEMFMDFEKLRPGAFLGNGFLLRSAFWVEGPIDVQRLRDAARAVVDRHQALRTAVVRVESTCVQRVYEPGAPASSRDPVVCKPLADVPEGGDAQRAAVMEALGSVAAEGIDPAAGSPLRIVLVSVTPTRHALMFIVHHMVGDAVSAVLVAREIAAAYNDLEAYRRLPAAEQYLDHLQRQAGERQAQWERNMAYWTRKLDGLQVLHLPHDRPRESRRSSGTTEVVKVDLQAATLEAVSAAAAASRSTRGIVLHAGFFCLMAARTGAHDIFIPTSFLGRVKPGSESVIGPFVQGLILRADLGGDPSFLEVVQRVRKSTFEAYDHLNLPLTTILATVPETAVILADPRYIFLYLQVQPHASAADLAFDGMAIEPFDHDDLWFSTETRPVTEDLTITLHERKDFVRFVARYDATLFDRSTVEGMIDDYVELVTRGAKDPATRLSALIGGLGHDREPGAAGA